MKRDSNIDVFFILIIFGRFLCQSKSAGGSCARSGILEINDDYVTQQFRENRERITLCPETVEDAELV